MNKLPRDGGQKAKRTIHIAFCVVCVVSFGCLTEERDVTQRSWELAVGTHVLVSTLECNELRAEHCSNPWDPLDELVVPPWPR